VVVVSTLKAPCILRSFKGLITRGEVVPEVLIVATGGGGGGAERGSLPSKAVRLDLLLGLNVGGSGELLLLLLLLLLLFVVKIGPLLANNMGDDGDGSCGGADWLSSC